MNYCNGFDTFTQIYNSPQLAAPLNFLRRRAARNYKLVLIFGNLLMRKIQWWEVGTTVVIDQFTLNFAEILGER